MHEDNQLFHSLPHRPIWNSPTPQQTRPTKRSQIWPLVEEAWKIDPIRNDVPAIIMDLQASVIKVGKHEAYLTAQTT